MNYFFCCRWRRHHQLAALKIFPSNNNGDSGTPKRQSSHKNNVWIWHMAIYERRTKQSVCVLWLARCVIAMNENTENDLRKCQRQYDVCKFGVCVCFIIFLIFAHYYDRVKCRMVLCFFRIFELDCRWPNVGNWINTNGTFMLIKWYFSFLIVFYNMYRSVVYYSSTIIICFFYLFLLFVRLSHILLNFNFSCVVHFLHTRFEQKK